MLSVSLPKKPKFKETGKNSGNVLIEACYPGFGVTLGNALRRVLLSSLEGAAVTQAKIKGVTHEFTTIKGVMEDMVQVIMNLKKVRFQLPESVDEATVFIKAKGEKVVTAKDIKTSSDVKIANPETHIATLTTSQSDFEVELKIKKGIGYCPIEQQQRSDLEIGAIAIDALYNPVKRVNFSVENMRVGKRTDYDKIILDISTDGTISPIQAYGQAVEILMGQFNAISSFEDEESDDDLTKSETEEKTGIDQIDGLDVSTRTMNVLKENSVSSIDQLVKMGIEAIGDLEGMGDKSLKEIEKALKKIGYELK